LIRTSILKEGKKMTEEKKEGIFKRLFGSKKGCCCDVKIEEVPEAGSIEESESVSSSGCCAPDTKKTE